MLVVSRREFEEVLIGDKDNPLGRIAVNSITSEGSVELLLRCSTSILVERQDGTGCLLAPTHHRHRHSVSLNQGDQLMFQNGRDWYGEVSVRLVQGGRVKLALEFPQSVRLLRCELVEESGSSSTLG